MFKVTWLRDSQLLRVFFFVYYPNPFGLFPLGGLSRWGVSDSTGRYSLLNYTVGVGDLAHAFTASPAQTNHFARCVVELINITKKKQNIQYLHKYFSFQGWGNKHLIGLLHIWLAKALILVVILSLEFEKFYIAMNKVQDTCALLLNSNCTGICNLLKIFRYIHRR